MEVFSSQVMQAEARVILCLLPEVPARWVSQHVGPSNSESMKNVPNRDN